MVLSSSVSAEPLRLSQDVVISPVSPKLSPQLLGRAGLSGCPPPHCQTLLQSCGAWTGRAGEVELGCSRATACRCSCRAQESSNPSVPAAGSAPGRWGGVLAPGGLFQDTFAGLRWECFSLVDAVCFRGDGALAAGADQSWWAKGQPGW